MKKGERNLFRLFTSLICVTILFSMLPASTVAADTDKVTIRYANNTTDSNKTLSEAISTINASEGTTNEAIKLELPAGTFSPTAADKLHITKSNLIIEGAGQDPTTETLIDTLDFAVSGQAGLMISGDDVTIRNLAIKSSYDANTSAIKVTTVGGSTVQDCIIEDVTIIDSQGSGIDIHTATDVDIIGVTIQDAGKVGISIADATGIYINNCTTVNTTWGADIGLMYNASSSSSYNTPCEVTIGSSNTFHRNVIASQRPSHANGGPDTVDAPGWIMEAQPAVIGMSTSWIMKPAENNPIPFKDEANNINFSTFELACTYAPYGSTITMQNDTTGGLVIPILAYGRDLIIDGGGHTISGGISEANTGAGPSSLTLQNFVFADSGVSLSKEIDEINITDNDFTNVSGHSIDIAAPSGTDPEIKINENSFISDSFSANSSESFVQISGDGLSGIIDLSHNYWNGMNPYYATAAGGVSIAELLNAGTAVKTVFPYYADAARTILVGENDAWLTPTSAAFDKNTSNKNYTDIDVTLMLGKITASGVSCEGTELTEGNQYTVNGNVYTFNKEWMSELPVGKHTISFDLSNGSSLNFILTVSDTTPGSAGNDTGGSPTDTTDKQSVVPETGDAISMTAWLALLLIALCGTIIAIYTRKKTFDKHEL